MTNTPTGKGTAPAVPSDPTDRIRESYEALPYPGGPHYGSHPDCLATVATLLGLAPADVERCRFLDLGCATGGNLIPMAVALPDSDFVGVDLAPGQIAQGQEVVDALGLTNVRLVAADLRDFRDEPGSFDYIVCHGVYSWVPEEVRRCLLDRVAELLAPGGIAMVSFNTYPGSQPRDTVRGLFRFALEEVLAPGDPVEAARSLLRILPKAFEGVEGDFARQLRGVAKEHVDGTAHYLGHEFLEEVNEP
ncbi:MAG: class I SAM-dependent methyltransferase, partial [Gemmatimonadota bacterium]